MEMDRLSFALEIEDDVSLSFPYWNQFMVDTVERKKGPIIVSERKKERKKESVVRVRLHNCFYGWMDGWMDVQRDEHICCYLSF